MAHTDRRLRRLRVLQDVEQQLARHLIEKHANLDRKGRCDAGRGEIPQDAGRREDPLAQRIDRGLESDEVEARRADPEGERPRLRDGLLEHGRNRRKFRTDIRVRVGTIEPLEAVQYGCERVSEMVVERRRDLAPRLLLRKRQLRGEAAQLRAVLDQARLVLGERVDRVLPVRLVHEDHGDLALFGREGKRIEIAMRIDAPPFVPRRLPARRDPDDDVAPLAFLRGPRLEEGLADHVLPADPHDAFVGRIHVEIPDVRRLPAVVEFDVIQRQRLEDSRYEHPVKTFVAFARIGRIRSRHRRLPKKGVPEKSGTPLLYPSDGKRHIPRSSGIVHPRSTACIAARM